MKITPLDIKQKNFTVKSFGKGYDRDEVAAFLHSLAQEWEMKNDEGRELKIKVELLEKEISKLKEVETSLFRTLKTAEETSANIIDQARKNSELKVREAQIKADVIMNDAREQAKAVVQKAQMRAKNTIEEMVNEMKSKEREYKDLENFKQNFVIDLRNFMNEAVEKVNRFEYKNANQYFEEKIKEAQEYLEERNELIDQQDFLNEYSSDRTQTSFDFETTNSEENAVIFNFANEPKAEDNNSFFETMN